MFNYHLSSPLGVLEITGTETALCSVMFGGARHKPAPGRMADSGDMPLAVQETIRQLSEYFAGIRQEFDLPLHPEGTDFRKSVWELLVEIPYSQCISYLELAKRTGDVKRARAVGLANGANPISIIIPCHRVIGSDGKLVGYGGDLWRKEWLLKHELENGPVPQGRLF